jgi:hypothetical protein
MLVIPISGPLASWVLPKAAVCRTLTLGTSVVVCVFSPPGLLVSYISSMNYRKLSTRGERASHSGLV